MKGFVLLSIGIALGLLCSTPPPQVSQLTKYQGRVVVSTADFGDAGQFKLALVLMDGAGTTIYWNNMGRATTAEHRSTLSQSADLTNSIPHSLNQRRRVRDFRTPH